MQFQMDESKNLPSLILSTSYFPPVSYYSLLIKFPSIVIDLHETYTKQTWRNRCTIMSGNGSLNLTVPVEKPHGNHTKTHDIIISGHSNWRVNHWRGIVSAYNNAPFFLYYKDMIEGLIFNNSHMLLYELNNEILKQLINEFGFTVNIEISRGYVRHPDASVAIDMRGALSPKNRKLQEKQVFNFPSYYQVFEDRFGFRPNMSILDLIFNKGPETMDYLKSVDVGLL
jgi:hypothetical protein